MQYKKLNLRLERQRQIRIFTRLVPTLLNRHLKPLLGWRRWIFLLAMFATAPRYRKTFARPGDDTGLVEVKRTFLLVGVLYQRLRTLIGEELAFRTAYAFLFDLANAVQRLAYTPSRGVTDAWSWFHWQHLAQIEEGFIRNNENDGIVQSEHQVSLHITRCRFHEAFNDMGNARLTEAFCRSDETVFNEISPLIRFHRGQDKPDTIARGAARCTFIYDRK